MYICRCEWLLTEEGSTCYCLITRGVNNSGNIHLADTIEQGVAMKQWCFYDVLDDTASWFFAGDTKFVTPN